MFNSNGKAAIRLGDETTHGGKVTRATTRSTPGSTHMHSDAHHAVTASKHISLASADSLLAAAGKNVRLFANQDMRLHAAKGKVQIQAQANDMELLAQKVLDIMGREGITLKSDKLIRLNVGTHAIQMTPGGGIEFLSPMSPQFHTAAVNLGNAKSMTEVIQSSPDSKFNEKMRMVTPAGQPYANWKYKLTRSDGTVLQGVTDAAGHAPILRHEIPDGCALTLQGPAS